MAVRYAIFFALCSSLLQQAVCVNVSTTKGVVAGYRADFGTDMSQTYYGSADVFLGIPYAAPPVGPLRFKPPQSSTAWNSLLNATSFESYKQCPQLNSFISSPQGSSEDCLYLNVFSPNVSSLVKYPVMVWIHGGAFVSGNAQFFGIKGTVRNLVSRGVVVVTLQYRLGLLGFFTTGTLDFPANLGMLDQVMALQWVKQEISAFGGDPSQVTIFGESAGGASVSAHTYSPLSKGLFQKAIMQSGVTLMELDGTHGYTGLSQLRAHQLCNFTSNQWASGNFTLLKQCLQNMTYEQLIALEWNNPLGWQIEKDNNFLPGWPRDLAANRTNIPILIGTNRDEWAYFEIADLLAGNTVLSNYTQSYYQGKRDQYTQLYGSNQTLVNQLIDKIYVEQIIPVPDPVLDNIVWFKIISQIITDASFASLAAKEVDIWQRINNNPNVFLYEFTYPTTSFALDRNLTWTPVFHASDTFYLWMQEGLWEKIPVGPADFTVANNFGQIWTDFAKNGKASWNPVTYSNPYQYMEINVNITMQQSYRETARLFWNEVMPAIVGVYPRDPLNNGQTTTTTPATTVSTTTPATMVSTATPVTTTMTTTMTTTTTTTTTTATIPSTVNITNTSTTPTTTTPSITITTSASESSKTVINCLILIAAVLIGTLL